MNRRLKRRRRNNFKKFIIYFLFINIFFVFFVGFLYIDKSLTPSIKILAETKAEEIGNRSINKAVGEIINGKIAYSDLMTTKIDSNGKISMIQSNTIEMNKIASDVALEIQNELKKVKTTTSYIPIGTALNSPILAKYGPKLKLSIEPIGTVYVNFKTEFEDAGINQTRHRIYLEVSTQVDIVVPLISQTKEIKAEVPICETIIVGDVPNSYVNVPEELSPNMYETE